MMYSTYYQAHVNKKNTWFLVATLRSFEHLVFDRTLDKDQCIIEFFVPADLEHYFENLLTYYQDEGIVHSFSKMTNRLKNPDEIV